MEDQNAQRASERLASLRLRLALDAEAEREVTETFGESAVPGLEAMLEDGDRRERLFALRTLLRIGARSAIATLLNLVAAEGEAGDSDVRGLALRGAVRALEPRDAARVTPFFHGLVSDPDAFIRGGAADGLAAVMASDSAVPLLSLAADNERFVAARARAAVEVVWPDGGELDVPWNPHHLSIAELARTLARQDATRLAALAALAERELPLDDLLNAAAEGAPNPALRAGFARTLARLRRARAEHAADPPVAAQTPAASAPPPAQPTVPSPTAAPAPPAPAVTPRGRPVSRTDAGAPIPPEVAEDAPTLLQSPPDVLREELRDLRRMNGDTEPTPPSDDA